jgi:multisubunit Na+/H+ antiporter MnhB subunit
MMHLPARRKLLLAPKGSMMLAQLVLLGACLVYPCAAQAYMGQATLEWVSMTILAPLAFLLIIITIVAAFVKPDVAKQAGYIAIIAVVLLALIKGGGAIINTLQAG